MATRLYFGTATAAPISPAVDANWERSIGIFARYQATQIHDGSPMADVAALFGATTSDDTCWTQWVTDPLPLPITISGTVTMVVRVQELSSTEDAFIAYSLRVLSNDGTTVRGTLKLHHDTSILEFNSGSATTRLVDKEALTPVAALAGDRIVLEMGVHGSTPDNLVNDIYRFGAPGFIADFDASAGLSTDLVPWWEMSMDVFAIPYAQRLAPQQRF